MVGNAYETKILINGKWIFWLDLILNRMESSDLSLLARSTENFFSLLKMPVSKLWKRILRELWRHAFTLRYFFPLRSSLLFIACHLACVSEGSCRTYLWSGPFLQVWLANTTSPATSGTRTGAATTTALIGAKQPVIWSCIHTFYRSKLCFC